MSVTIDSLDIQIRSSAGSAAKNINDLANALDKLNGSAKVTKVVNSLGKLNTALADMRSQSGVMGQLSSLSQSLAKLSSVPEMTGLKSAIKELKKLPEVMKSLSTTEITRFSEQMKLLSKGLTPLATQIDKIGKGFSKLPPQVSKCVTAVKRLDSANRSAAKSTKSHGEALDRTSFNLLASYEHLSNVFSMINSIQAGFSKLLTDAMQWDGISFQFGRAFGEHAEMVLDYADKVSEALLINKQQFMESASLYGSLLKGFGVEQKQVTTMAVGLAELSYDIWAAYNNRYKTLDDASEAVRSAITGEIEPIRNAGIALTEASMQEYLDSVGMAHISIEKLTEAQKSEVRYATMVNAAMNQGIIGTYAREMNTAEGAVRTLTQQLRTLGQAIGSLFIPMLKVVVPWLTAFVQLVTEGVIALGALFGIKFQEITWGNATGMAKTAEGANATADALGDAAKSAKAMKDYAMGFDELIVIDPSSASGGSGSGGTGGVGGGSLGLDLDTLWDDAVFASASKQVDELKQKIKDYINEHKLMLSVVAGTAAFLGFMKALRGLNSLLGVSKTIANLAVAFGGLKTAWVALSGVFGNVKAFFSLLKDGAGLGPTLAATFPKISSALTTAASAVGTFLSGITAPAWAVIAAVIASVASAVYFLSKNWDEVKQAVKGFFAENIAPKLNNIRDSWENIKEALSPITKLFGGMIDAVKEVIKWLDSFINLGGLIEGFGGIVVAVLGGSIAGSFNAVMSIIEGFVKAVEGIVGIVEGVVRAVYGLLTGDFESAWEAAEDTVMGVVNLFKGLWKMTIGAVKEFVNGVISWFKNLWDELVGHSIVPDTINSIVDWFLSLPNRIFSPLRSFCDGVAQRFREMWVSIVTWYKGNVAPKLTTSFWMDKFRSFKTGFVQTVKNMLNAGIDMINKFISWLNSKMRFSWDSLKVAGKTIVPAGSVQLFRIPQITQRFADGGFIEDGLFTMNRGEIAGKFSNGKSVVANNQQIVEGIAAGVYQAVVQAMNDSGGRSDQNLNVYLDGRQIYASIKKTESERGRSLLGSQLGYVY